MEMIIKRVFKRRSLVAIAIIFGVNATPCLAAETELDINNSEMLQDAEGAEVEENEVQENENLETGDAANSSTSEEISNNEESSAVGWHVQGAKNSFTPSGNINSSSFGAIGILVDGLENKIILPRNVNVQSGGKGILISYGRDHNLNIDGNISATGNAIEFNFDTTATGENRGSYLRYRSGSNAENALTFENLPIVMAEGEFTYSADELNGALVNDFNLSGKIAGGSNAIYIGRNSFVRNININGDAQISGNIVSDWKHLSNDAIKIQYGGSLIDATKYIPDLVTNLNFNTSMNYDGRISGADNIKMHVNAGSLRFSGSANVISVEVMTGAQLYGGTYTLNDMTERMAGGFSDWTTGKFINHGTLAAGSPNSNLIINGDLISDGILQKVSGGTGGSIIVNGNANIEGSTVTTDSLLPNETATVLIADSISGNIKNPDGNPVPISATLNASGKIVDNALLVTTHEASNVTEMNSGETETFDAMNSMFANLEDNELKEEMRGFYNLEPTEAKKTLKEIGANDSAQIMSVAQQNTAVDKMISNRISRVFAPDTFTPDTFTPDTFTPDTFTPDTFTPDTSAPDTFTPDTSAPDYVDVNINPLNFAEGDSNAPEMKIKVKVPARRHENNFWINYMKNWGSLRGGTDYHGSVIVGGYDRPFGKKWRAGVFATYGTIGYGADASRATVYDTRLGLYAGYHNKASDVYFYINGGQLRNSLHRGIYSLGLSTNANYKSHIAEIGGEYKYDLQPKKKWHVSPFINFQASYLKQNSYNERGAGIYNQHVEGISNTYFAMQTGVDLKRYYRAGMLGFRLGVKRGFTGADPDLKISYEGNASNSYRIRQERDKTHFICALRGESEIARGWFMGGEAELQLGENDKDVTASFMIRRTW